MTRWFLAAGAAVLLLAGCQAINERPGLRGDAVDRVGQLRYSTATQSLVGDVVLQSLRNGDYDLSFAKSGVSVLSVQVRGDLMTATGLLARFGWTGTLAHAPRALGPWAQLKQIVPHFETTESAAQEPRRWTATFLRQGTKLLGTEIKFSRGQKMTFSFAR